MTFNYPESELCPHCQHPIHSHSQYACTIGNCRCRVSEEDAKMARIMERIMAIANNQSNLSYQIGTLRSAVATLSGRVERLLYALKNATNDEEEE